jgi:hypothetical protein
MEGYCSTGQSPQLAVVPMEEEEEETQTLSECDVSRSVTEYLVTAYRR